MADHIDCPCWATGVYVWVSDCPEHVVEHPHYYSLDSLKAMWELRRRKESSEA